MKPCQICNEVACDNDMCEKAINETRKRIVEQVENFNKITGKKPIEKECCEVSCKARIFHPKQYCEPCRKDRLNERRRKDRERRRKMRFCNCGASLDGQPNSRKYCSDKCRPKKQATARALRHKERPPRKVSTKSYGLDKWTKPRGSKKRKELGLPEIKYSNSGVTGGYAVTA